MYETSDLIAAAILAALAGLVIGIVLHRSVGTSAGKLRDLEKKLAREKESNQQYKSNVTRHFSETASLLTDLTLKYKDIHDHLASGADQLCRDAQGRSLLPDSPVKLRIEERPDEQQQEAETSVKPPLDYAPKQDSDPSGQLAEDFGLEKIRLEEDLASNPVPGAFAASENVSHTNSSETDSKV